MPTLWKSNKYFGKLILLFFFYIEDYMKKTISVVAGLVLLFALVFVSIPNNVQAGYSVTKQSIAAGEWNTGTMVKVDLTAAPAPEWLQLMTTDAVVLEEPTKICHEFGGGKFHWVGEIRQLKDGRWIAPRHHRKELMPFLLTITVRQIYSVPQKPLNKFAE